MKKASIFLMIVFVVVLFVTCRPALQYSLTITIIGTGTITANGNAVTSGKAILFDEDTKVKLIVIPETNWQFDDWTGTNEADVIGIGPYTIVMNANKFLIATFITGGNTSPAASNVAISGIAQVGQTLTGSYTYTDAESDLEGTSAFRWLSSSTETGTYNAITGATALTYVLQASDENQYIKFEVTPIAQTGTTTGTPVQSNSVGPVLPPILITADPTTLDESATNDGSIDPNVITIAVTNSTFIQAQVIPTNITSTGLPANLTLANPTYVDTTHITIEIDGNATAHQNANDTTFTITVASAVLTDAITSATTGNITIDFDD
jgi:hypothetical protein